MEKLKIFLRLIAPYFIYIFFQVKWLDKECGSGYFLLKRWWVWVFTILPFCMIFSVVRSMIFCILDLFDYDYHWIGGGEKKKLSFKEKLYLGERLLL
ncbi:MAG: hypothetical protein PHW73_00045 [Atribacterota bacterium]|nr:hypothetical protein [Atribacterota bacterium]